MKRRRESAIEELKRKCLAAEKRAVATRSAEDVNRWAQALAEALAQYVSDTLHEMREVERSRECQKKARKRKNG
ncbi:MAG: hypothetical protein AAB408_03895 [Patescibacteria group bacterium]